MNIAVVTDSSCDLPASVAQSNDIAVVPLTIRFDDEALIDGVEIDTPGFWRRLTSSDHLPETAAPSPGAFLTAFAEAGDVDGIVCLCLSSELSGTYQSAVLAAEETEVPVMVIDTHLVSVPLGLATLEAARVAAAGGDLEAVAGAAIEACRRAGVLAAIDTLDFLERGGRIGRVSALVGGLLDIKPLITLADGVVTGAGRVRTHSKAIIALAEHIARRDLDRLAVFQGGGADLGPLMARLPAATPEPMMAELGPVVGTHTGPGVVGVAYLDR